MVCAREFIFFYQILSSLKFEPETREMPQAVGRILLIDGFTFNTSLCLVEGPLQREATCVV